MCGRFTVALEAPRQLADRFGGAPPPAETVRRYNVAPTESVAAVRAAADGDGREGVVARWGLLPPWATTLKERVAPINARAEGIGQKRMFAPLLARAAGRVLVPADGWYEWLRGEDPRQPRIPFHHVVDDGAPFAFAGLLRISDLPEVGRTASLTLVTTAANAECARLHDRMPVVLADRDAERAWLSGDLAPEDAAALLAPLSAGRVALRPANPRVNKAGGPEGPFLLDPDAGPEDPPAPPGGSA